MFFVCIIREEMKSQEGVEQEILRTLNSISRSAVETDKVSAATAEVVVAQGEQIDNINRNAQKVQENLNTSEWLIRGMKSWGGRIQNALYGPSSDRYPSEIAKGLSPGVPRENIHTAPSSQTAKPDFDQQFENHLDNISNVLGGIHARSLELHHEIARQVHTVDSVDKSLQRSNDRIRKQHNDIKSLR